MIRRIESLLKNKLIFKLLICFFVVGLTLTSGFQTLDAMTSDSLYQNAESLDGNVIVIGMDSHDLDYIGPWPWDRSFFAMVLQNLNAYEEYKPAAIGVDIVFSGEIDPDTDEYLAYAASDDNVVFSMMAEYADELRFDEDGNAYMDSFYISNLAYPFDALRNVAEVGHINSMYDEDGVLRRHLWSLQPDDEEEIISLPYLLYEKYQAYWGLEADFDPPRDEQGFWWLNYSAEPGDYFYYNITDILEGNYEPSLMAGAVVLIGPYDPGFSDHFITSMDRAGRMYGVEYMANVVTAMINDDYKLEARDHLQLIGLFVVLLVSLALFDRFSVRYTLSLLIGEVAFFYFICIKAYEMGYVTHPLWIPFGLIFGYLCIILRGYVESRREKRFIMQTFNRYVDPDIIDELMKEGSDSLSLGGRSCEIAVLFVDIRGFTTLSEKMTPENIVQMLNQYLTLTSTSIKETGGTVDKFVGDCTMAFWGAPLPCEDPVYAACKSAMLMVEGATKLGEKIYETYGQYVYFGVGVNYGPAVVGNIGAIDRMDYTAIGDTVNTAARLEANAPAGCVYISRVVADMLGDRGEYESFGGSIPLKGKESGYEVLRLLRLK